MKIKIIFILFSLNQIIFSKSNLLKSLSTKVLLAHPDKINTMSFSANGKFLATGSNDRTAKIWSVETGKLVFSTKRLLGSINVVALNSDGKLLLTGYQYKNFKYDFVIINIWDVPNKCLSISKMINGINIFGLTCSPDDKLFAAALDKKLKICDMQKGKDIYTISKKTIFESEYFEDEFHSLAFSDDSKFLGFNRKFTGLHVIDLISKEIINLSFPFNCNFNCSVAFSSDNDIVARGDYEIFYLQSKQLKTIEIYGDSQCTRITRDNKFLITSGNDNIRVTNLETDELEVLEIDEKFETSTFSKDLNLFAAGFSNGTIKIWDFSKIN